MDSLSNHNMAINKGKLICSCDLFFFVVTLVIHFHVSVLDWREEEKRVQE